MDIKARIDQIPHIKKIIRYAKREKDDIYLVGGFLRDVYLKRKEEPRDFDFAVFEDAGKAAQQFARISKGTLVRLDEDTKSYRVALKIQGLFYRYDFTNFRAPTLEGDLQRRDFTINTLSVHLNAYPRVEVKDYTRGFGDIRKRILRAPSPHAFLDDPLRILRAFSLGSIFSFRIEPRTLKRMVQSKRLLGRVSAERIAEELFKIFRGDHSFSAIKAMSDMRVLDEILPEIKDARGCTQGEYHHLEVWEHSLYALRKLEELLRRRHRGAAVGAYLREEIAAGRPREALLKFGCLLHDLGKPKAKKQKKGKTIFYEHERYGREIAETIASRLKLSVNERQFLKTVIFWHLRPGCLVQNDRPTDRAVLRYFRDTEQEGISILLLSIADWRATRGRLVDLDKRAVHERILFKLIGEYFTFKRKKEIPPLVRGDAIMQKFHIQPSVLVGKVLKKVREEQLLGCISTKAEAYTVAKKVINTERKLVNSRRSTGDKRISFQSTVDSPQPDSV